MASIEQNKRATLQTQVQWYKKQLIGSKPLIETRRILWKEMISYISESWELVVVIEEEAKFLRSDKEAKDQIQCELGNKPIVATKIINFLISEPKNNSKNQDLMTKLNW